MLALRLQHFAIRPERGENRVRLRGADACQHWLDFFEAATAGFAGSRLGELIEGVLGLGSFGLQQCIVNGRDLAQAVHLVAANLEQRHAGKGVHLRGIVLNEVLHGSARGGVLVRGAAAGKGD